ncbi:MAG: DUF4124 domain-containing protein [Burkholderiales bacterium]|nr:DUF4124 domain-containing protein [Burkholderiales bacterium]
MKQSGISLCLFLFGLSCSDFSQAQGQLHKCVNASGKTFYTDQACAAKTGEAVKDVTDSNLLKKVNAINGERDAEKICWTLSHRKSQCYDSVRNEVATVFKENCTIPIKHYEQQQEKDQYTSYRRNRTKKEQEDADDLEYNNRYLQKSRAVLQCERLEKDMWEFLNKTYSDKISEQDKRTISYKLKHTPNERGSRYEYNND